MIKQFFTSLILGVTLAGPLVAQGLSGPYLAATSANIANDYEQAAHYYRRAMESDPGNGFIMQGAMVASIAAGHFDDGVKVAQKMVDAGFTDEYAQTVLVANAFSKGKYDLVLALLADEQFTLNPLLKVLIKGWALVGKQDYAAADLHFSTTSQNDAIDSFANYHNALAAALAGNYPQASELFGIEGAYVNRGSILAHAEILAVIGQRDAAFELLTVGPGRAAGDREADNLRAALANGDVVEFTQINQPADAVSEAFLVLGDALNGDNSPRLALFFSRLAQMNQPDNTEALLLIAEILTEQNQFSLAVNAFAKIPADDAFVVNAAIGHASALQRDNQADAAIGVLENLVASQPADLTAWRALGDVLRRESRFLGAFDAYSKAVDLLPDPDFSGAWRLYYTRAIAAERLKDWPAADWNFRQALALNPDQPDVLNYLGYSLVERGEKLDEALAMIETAVAARPESGYIADSLGWIYYRLGRFDEAVPVMENAIMLLPDDPIVNDHLGDVLWMVGRHREARFQWRRALSFDPEDIDAERIRWKLTDGLDAVLEAEKDAPAD